MMRLNKYLATYGNVSRREADRLVFAGKVIINSVVADSPGIQVDEVNDTVILNGETIEYAAKSTILKFYKPIKCLTAYGDGRGRTNLNHFELLKSTKIPYSGRLDYESEGLILFTNDGDLIYKLQKPKYKVPKEYLVKTSKPLQSSEISTLTGGVTVEGVRYGKCSIIEVDYRLYRFILHEGKNRQIRKMLAHFNLRVIELKRVSVGPIQLGDMVPGEIRELSKSEIKELLECIESE